MTKRKPSDMRGTVRLGKPSPNKLPANARKLTPAKMGRFAIDFLNDNPDYAATVEDALVRHQRGPGRFRGLSVRAFMVGALVPLLITYFAPVNIETWAILVAVVIALTLTSIVSSRAAHLSMTRTLGRSLIVGGITLLVSYVAGELLLG